MSKKLITACVTLVAAAFILPATASASPLLTHPTGTALATGNKLTGTNIGEMRFISGSTVLFACTKATFTGELTKNNGTTFEGNITTATVTGTGTEAVAGMPECTASIIGNFTMTTNGGGVDENTVAGGTPWCMKSTMLGSLTIRGGKCSEAERAIKFVLDGTTSGACHYSRSAGTPITGTYTTDTTGDAILSLTSEGTVFTKEVGDPLLCPERFSLELKSTLETDTSTASPVYVS